MTWLLRRNVERGTPVSDSIRSTCCSPSQACQIRELAIAPEADNTTKVPTYERWRAASCMRVSHCVMSRSPVWLSVAAASAGLAAAPGCATAGDKGSSSARSAQATPRAHVAPATCWRSAPRRCRGWGVMAGRQNISVCCRQTLRCAKSPQAFAAPSCRPVVCGLPGIRPAAGPAA